MAGKSKSAQGTTARSKSAAKAAGKSGKSKRGNGAAANGLAAIVLAAGKGTRMRSARAKVLHELLGRPLVAYPVGLARELGASPVVAVLGHQLEAVEAVLAARFGEGGVTVVEQSEQRGTGHAVRLAMPALRRFEGVVLVLYGDVPLLRRETLQELAGTARRYQCLAIVTATPEDATGYGRVVRDSRGHVTGIVEEKDATPEERAIGEVNAGIYAAPAAFLRKATAGLVAKNAQGEYYLTDIIAVAARSIGVTSVDADARDVAGINDREQLAAAEDTMRARINRHWQTHATFRDPASTVVEPDVTIEVDAEIGRNVTLRGRIVRRTAPASRTARSSSTPTSAPTRTSSPTRWRRTPRSAWARSSARSRACGRAATSAPTRTSATSSSSRRRCSAGAARPTT